MFAQNADHFRAAHRANPALFKRGQVFQPEAISSRNCGHVHVGYMK